MTALKKYQRLESPGLWREDLTAQRREVVVAFREATLVLFDPRTETPLSHWSLPALERANPGVVPAIFSPGEDSEESVEIDDAEMIAAIEQVRGVVKRRRPRPGRLRGSILGLLLVSVVGISVIFLPETIYTHTAKVIPHATRQAIGAAAMADIERLTGAPCDTPRGRAALVALSMRIFGAGGTKVFVLREGLTRAANLPGPITLLPRSAVESQRTPEASAGFVLAESQRAKAADPLVPILRHAGLLATLRLLTTGVLPAEGLDGYGETFLAATAAPLPDDVMLTAFAEAKISSAPYGYAVDATGETTLGLIEADPWRDGSPDPVLSSDDWDALQGICVK